MDFIGLPFSSIQLEMETWYYCNTISLNKSTWQILKGEGRGKLDFVLTNDVAVKNLQ